MKQLDDWIIDNAQEGGSVSDLESEIPFAIWKRQWEVFDLTGDRLGSERIAQKAERLSGRGKSYKIIATIYKSQVLAYHGDFAGAFSTAQGLTTQVGEDVAQKLTASVYNQIGQSCLNLSDFERAIEYRQKAMEIFKLMDDSDSYGNGLASLGMINWKMGDYPKAMGCLEEAREIFERSSNQRSLAMTITNIANVMLATDQVEQANQFYTTALNLCRKIGDVAKQSSILNNLGAICYRQGDITNALSLYQQGYRLDLQLGNVTGQATKLANMAIMLASMGRHQEALEKFNQALKLDNESGNLDGQMKKLGNMSSLYGLIGDFDRAMESVDKAIEICRRINAKGYLGHCLGMRSSFLTHLDKNREAEASALEALEISIINGNLSQLANNHCYLAEIYLAVDDLEKGREHSQKAIELMESHQLFEIYRENIYFTHYRIMRAAGEQDEARMYIEKSYDEVMKRVKDLPAGVSADEFIGKNETLQNIVRERTKAREKV